MRAMTHRRILIASIARRHTSNFSPRVLLVNSGYPPAFNGGSEVYTQVLANCIQKHNCNVSVFAREQNPFQSDFKVRVSADEINPKVNIWTINHAREAPYNRFVNKSIEDEFENMLRKINPDVVHFQHLNHLSANLPSVTKRVLGSDVVNIYTLHDFWLMCPRGQFLVTGPTDPKTEPWKLCDGQNDRKCAKDCFAGRFATGLSNSTVPDLSGDKELHYWTEWIAARMNCIQENLESIDAYIAPSLHIQDKFCKQFNVPTEKVLLLPYGFDKSRLSGRVRTPKGSDGRYVFGYIGRHQPAKGIDRLIDAAIILAASYPETEGHFRVKIFGRPDSATTPALKRLQENSILRDGDGPRVVEWLPEYHNTDIVSTVFNHVDAIVMPSIWEENSPLVIQEAQQCRVPVITADVGGMAELVQHQVNGLTFTHRSAKSLAAAMRWALSNQQEMADLGKWGYLASADGQVPSIQDHTTQVLKLYEERLLQRPQQAFEQGHLSITPTRWMLSHANDSEACYTQRDVPTPFPIVSWTERNHGNQACYTQDPDLESSALPTNDTAANNPSSSESTPAGVCKAGADSEGRAYSRGEEHSVLQPSGPWRVTFDTNPDDCNFKCTMCEQHSELSPLQRERREQKRCKRRMDFAIIDRTTRLLAATGCLKEIIPTTMGEPLMYKHFEAMLDLCNELGIRMNLTTNGSFYGKGVERWARLIVPVCVDVKFSWNGATEKTQQQIMKGSQLSKQLSNLREFIAIRDEIAAAGGNRCSVTLQVTFMEQNLQEIPAIVELAIAHGCDRVKGHHLWAHFDEIADQNLRRSVESAHRWNEVAAYCRKLADEKMLPNGKKLQLDHFEDLIVPKTAVVEGKGDFAAATAVSVPEEAVCPFLGREAWINSEGRFDPCCAPDAQRRQLGYFGNVNDPGESVQSIMASTSYRNLEENYKRHSLCNTCTMRKLPNELNL